MKKDRTLLQIVTEIILKSSCDLRWMKVFFGLEKWWLLEDGRDISAANAKRKGTLGRE